MIKRKYIVAGNYDQYQEYIRKKNDINIEFIYVDSPNKIRGLSDIEGYYIGTYYNRPDIENIKEIIRITKAYKPAEDSVYGNVTAFKRDYREFYDNSMIDSMRDDV